MQTLSATNLQGLAVVSHKVFGLCRPQSWWRVVSHKVLDFVGYGGMVANHKVPPDLVGHTLCMLKRWCVCPISRTGHVVHEHSHEGDARSGIRSTHAAKNKTRRPPLGFASTLLRKVSVWLGQNRQTRPNTSFGIDEMHIVAQSVSSARAKPTNKTKHTIWLRRNV